MESKQLYIERLEECVLSLYEENTNLRKKLTLVEAKAKEGSHKDCCDKVSKVKRDLRTAMKIIEHGKRAAYQYKQSSKKKIESYETELIRVNALLVCNELKKKPIAGYEKRLMGSRLNQKKAIQEEANLKCLVDVSETKFDRLENDNEQNIENDLHTLNNNKRSRLKDYSKFPYTDKFKVKLSESNRKSAARTESEQMISCVGDNNSILSMKETTMTSFPSIKENDFDRNPILEIDCEQNPEHFNIVPTTGGGSKAKKQDNEVITVKDCVGQPQLQDTAANDTRAKGIMITKYGIDSDVEDESRIKFTTTENQHTKRYLLSLNKPSSSPKQNNIRLVEEVEKICSLPNDSSCWFEKKFLTPSKKKCAKVESCFDWSHDENVTKNERDMFRQVNETQIKTETENLSREKSNHRKYAKTSDDDRNLSHSGKTQMWEACQSKVDKKSKVDDTDNIRPDCGYDSNADSEFGFDGNLVLNVFEDARSMENGNSKEKRDRGVDKGMESKVTGKVESFENIFFKSKIYSEEYYKGCLKEMKALADFNDISFLVDAKGKRQLLNNNQSESSYVAPRVQLPSIDWLIKWRATLADHTAFDIEAKRESDISTTVEIDACAQDAQDWTVDLAEEVKGIDGEIYGQLIRDTVRK